MAYQQHHERRADEIPNYLLVAGVFIILGGSVILTFSFPHGVNEPPLPDACYADQSRPHEFYSMFLGWLYFIAWSISFYPQIYLNFVKNSVKGLSLDFSVLNLFAFACYSLFNITFYYVDSVTEKHFFLFVFLWR